MTTDGQVLAEKLDLEMLERPHLWPGRHLGFPCIMLKKLNKRETAKCVMEDTNTWLVAAFDWEGPRPVEAKILRYASAEAVTAAGWVID